MEIQVSQGYLQARINAYKKKYVIEYFKENNTYPSIDEIANMTIPDDVMANINRDYYVNYLISEADKLDDYNNESSMLQSLYGCWELNKINGNEAGFGKANFMYIQFDSTYNRYFVYNENYPKGNFGSFEYVKYGNNYLLECREETILGGYNYTVSLVNNTLILTRTDDLSKVLEFNKIETLTNYYPDIVGTHQYTYDNTNYVVSFFEDNTCDLYYSKDNIGWNVINDNRYDIFYGDFGFEKTYILTEWSLEPKTAKIEYDKDNIILTAYNPKETIMLTKIEDVPEHIVFSALHTPLGKSWIELPNMDDDLLEYYSHSFEYNGKTYCNYSFGWSQNDRISKWVAYPLDYTYMNKHVDRTDAWAIDPLLGEEKSSAPFRSYSVDYVRGMLIPSASRLCCELANEQVFYGSNIFPALPSHDQKIWADVESRIRNVADASHCTYVLKGLITSENSITTTDSNGNNVTVPDAIYAVILKRNRNSTYGEWNACAFYTEHKEYTDYDLTQIIMSVSDLESITGMEYFVALKDLVGEEQYNTIKSTLNQNVFV